MPLVPLLIYLGLCLLVGLRGTRTRIGFWGTFFLSILITPVIMYLALVLLNPPPPVVVQASNAQGGSTS